MMTPISLQEIKKAAEKHCEVEKLDKAETANAKPKEDNLLKQEDKEKSKAEVVAKGMKKVEPNTTKDVVEDSKVYGGVTLVLEDGKR